MTGRTTIGLRLGCLATFTAVVAMLAVSMSSDALSTTAGTPIPNSIILSPTSATSSPAISTTPPPTYPSTHTSTPSPTRTHVARPTPRATPRPTVRPVSTTPARPRAATTSSYSVPLETLKTSTDSALIAAIAASQKNASKYAVTQSIVVVNRSGLTMSGTSNLHTAVLSMSTIKLLIASDVYYVHGGASHVSGSDTALLHEMITVSSNDAATRLYDEYGGRAMLDRVIARYHLSDTRSGETWGGSYTSAYDLAHLLIDVDHDPHVGPPLYKQMSEMADYNGTTLQKYGVGDLTGVHGAKQGYGYAPNASLLIHSAGYTAARVIVIMSWEPRNDLQNAYATSDYTAMAVSSAA